MGEQAVGDGRAVQSAEIDAVQGQQMSDWTTYWDEQHSFPFIEDEHANITGLGHQDRQAFVDAVNLYDEVCQGYQMDPEDQWDADYIGHDWALMDDDGERLHRCTSTDPGAFPITTLWEQR